MGTFVTANPHVPLPADRTNNPKTPPTGLTYEVDASHINDTQNAVNDVYTNAPKWLSAASYNAKGDNSTDDTAALRAFFAALNAATGNVSAYLPGGTYLYNKPLRLTGSFSRTLSFRGALGGVAGTGAVLKWNGPPPGVVQVGGLVRVGSTVTATVTAHGFSVGEYVALAGGVAETSFPFGEKLITARTADTFSWTEPVTASDATSAQAYQVGYAMLTLAGVSGSTFEDFELNGNYTALYGLWAFGPCTSNRFNRVAVSQCGLNPGATQGVGQLGGACWVFAQAPNAVIVGTSQCSEFHFTNCFGGGNDGNGHLADSVFLWLSGGNAKNFHMHSGKVDGGYYGFNALAPGGGVGPLNIENWNVETCLLTYIGNNNQAVLKNVEVETNLANSLFAQQLNATNPGSLHIENCFWAGGAPSDDIIIKAQCQLTVLDNQFSNTRVPNVSIPIVRLDGAVGAPYNAGVGGGGYASSLVSRGNVFYNLVPAAGQAVCRAPFQDSSGNFLTPTTEPSGNTLRSTPARVRSEFDMGFDQVNELFYSCPNIQGFPSQLPLLFPQASSAGVVNRKLGEIGRGKNSWVIPYTALTGTAGLTKDLVLGILPNKSKLCAAYIDVGTAFAGTATLVAKLGISTGGNELLVDTSVKTATTTTPIGGASGDLGTGLSGAVQGGYTPNWAGQPTLSIRFTSTVNNLTALTAGSLTVTVELDNYQD